MTRRHIAVKTIGLGFGLVLGLLAFSATEAEAQCSTGFRLIGGVCYRVKGVAIEAEVKRTGNLQQNPKSFHGEIIPTGTGVLFCGNPGGKQPPGQRLVVTQQSLSCVTQVDPQDIVSPQNGGTAQVTCTALLQPDELETLGTLFCSKGHTAIDFVPCEFTSTVTYRDDRLGTALETAQHSCTLPLCENLTWVGDTLTGFPEPRAYQCGAAAQ